MAKLKFTKTSAFPGFPTGFRTNIPEFGTVDLVTLGTGNIAVEWTDGERHILLEEVFTPQGARKLCQSIADTPNLRNHLLTAIKSRIKEG